MRVLWMMLRGIVIAAVAIGCAALALRIGAWLALGCWALACAMICGIVALLMQRQPPEKIGIVNYAAGVVLPWGYRIGRGKLMGIVATSWAIWVLVGAAAIIAVTSRGEGGAAVSVTADGKRSPLVMTLLFLSWAVDGAVLLRIIGLIGTSADPARFVRSLGTVMLAVLAMIGASVALVLTSDSALAARVALGIAGGPPLAIGLG